MDSARLATVVFVWPEGTFRLILHNFDIASIAPVHILRIILILKFLGVIHFFGMSIICSFEWFGNTAWTYAGVTFLHNTLIVMVRIRAATITVIWRAGPQWRVW